MEAVLKWRAAVWCVMSVPSTEPQGFPLVDCTSDEYRDRHDCYGFHGEQTLWLRYGIFQNMSARLMQPELERGAFFCCVNSYGQDIKPFSSHPIRTI